MIKRTKTLAGIKDLFRTFPAVALLGARQVGKTTLAIEFAKRSATRATVFDLEDPADLARLSDPMLALQDLEGLIVLDEVQRKPELFPVLRVLIDRNPKRQRYLLLGSASPHLLRQTSESLAGRIAYRELGPLWIEEVGADTLAQLWLRGGFPRSFLARSNGLSHEWRHQFIRTFLERDIPQLGFSIPSTTLHRFWSMLTHYHGQLWNASEFGRSFGLADTTVRRYLDLLTDTFVVRQLKPWASNIGKRQVKAPKIYIADSGLLHALLGIESQSDLDRHPTIGASWEGFLIEQVLRLTQTPRDACYFWRTHAGAELDLLIQRRGANIGFEFKRTVSPSVTPSMRSAMEDLSLQKLYVVHAGNDTYPLAKNIQAVAAFSLLRSISG
jgi:predicted AAA+ superfamily ATPase